MTDLPTTVLLIVLGTQVPDGYVKVECPWAQAKEVWKPRYITSMPSGAIGPYGTLEPNPDYYEFTCVRPQPFPDLRRLRGTIKIVPE